MRMKAAASRYKVKQMLRCSVKWAFARSGACWRLHRRARSVYGLTGTAEVFSASGTNNAWPSLARPKRPIHC